MAPEKTPQKNKEVEEIVEAKVAETIEAVPEIQSEWKAVTALGKRVKKGEITDLEEIFDKGYTILEAGITDALLPDIESDLVLIGQAKGKFGGGQRRIFRQVQKKTAEGNKINFVTCAIIGNKNGYLGVGFGKSKETVPSRDKALREAKINLIRVRRGCGSWECNCHHAHSIPFAVEGRCGSTRVTLIPAPKGKGLCIEKECAKVLSLAGIKDIWSKSSGQTRSKVNLVQAITDALKKLSQTKIKPDDIPRLGIVDGRLKEITPESTETKTAN